MYPAENITIDCTMGTWIDTKTTGKIHIHNLIMCTWRGIEELDNYASDSITKSQEKAQSAFIFQKVVVEKSTQMEGDRKEGNIFF